MEITKENTHSNETGKFVTFSIEDESFAVNILNVQEINQMNEITITRVPKSPNFLKGVLNLRGKIVPVINFRVRLGLHERECGHAARVIIAKLKGNLYGLMVDSISSVVELAQSNIDPPPSSLEGIDAEYIEGISKEGGNLMTILNLGKILSFT